ncbi:hypothetical protein JOD17_000153 [Geomicrobium sediminis]|uniref:DUF4234 domain-containing protein n=1 Tax=Geomicrobium sediminis TaxID=1347788 RepID=A0ABS2P6V2_9BACL|nr:hypothetical protein [Geomicrobium sediminis]
MTNTESKQIRNRLFLYFFILFPFSIVAGRYLSELGRSGEIASISDIVSTGVISMMMFGLIYFLFKKHLIYKMREEMNTSKKKIIIGWGVYLTILILLVYGIPFMFNLLV